MRFIYAQIGNRNPKRSCANDNSEDFGERKNVPGLPDWFTVSDGGFVYKNDRRLKGFVSDKGYRRVSLCVNGKTSNHYVHALIAAAFIGPRPSGHHVDHINFDPSDNRPQNLRYLSAADNSMRTRTRGRRGAKL